MNVDLAALVAPERRRIADVLAEVAQGLAHPERVVELYGAAGALGPAIAAELARSSRSPLLYVVADEEAVESRLSDLGFFLPHASGDDPLAPPAALELPAPESSPYAEMQPDRRTILRRMAVLYRLTAGPAPRYKFCWRVRHFIAFDFNYWCLHNYLVKYLE